MKRRFVTLAAAILLCSTRVEAQTATQPSTDPPSPKAAIVIGLTWTAMIGGDIWSDHYAVTHARTVEANPLLGGDPQGRYMTEIMVGTLGAYGTTVLWQTGHKRLAIAVVAADALVRGYVIQRNIRLGMRGMDYIHP